MKEKQFAVAPSITADEMKTIRKRLNLTQKELARLLGCSKPTIERWEVSEKPITGPVVLALYFLNQDSNVIDQLLIPEKQLPLRLKYMYKQQLCTIIDVDELNQIVRIKNYVSNLMMRAFGRNENPSYQEYEEFLESRCFPESRDKMKLVLKDLGLPFYDPILIIGKTEGRMAEDHFWIKMER